MQSAYNSVCPWWYSFNATAIKHSYVHIGVEEVPPELLTAVASAQGNGGSGDRCKRKTYFSPLLSPTLGVLLYCVHLLHFQNQIIGNRFQTKPLSFTTTRQMHREWVRQAEGVATVINLGARSEGLCSEPRTQELRSLMARGGWGGVSAWAASWRAD